MCQKCYWIFYPSVHSLSSHNAMESVRKRKMQPRKVSIKTNSYGASFLGKRLGAPGKYPLSPPLLRGLLMSTVTWSVYDVNSSFIFIVLSWSHESKIKYNQGWKNNQKKFSWGYIEHAEIPHLVDKYNCALSKSYSSSFVFLFLTIANSQGTVPK